MLQAPRQLETKSEVRLHPKLAAVKQVLAVVLVLVSVALQLDPQSQRIANVALKRGDNVLPGCVFNMYNTDRLSSVENGLFQTKLDGTAQIPLTNNSAEGMYFEYGDQIAEASTIDVASVMKVTDANAQDAVNTLPVDQQLAVELCRAELSSMDQQPEMTDPTQIRQLFESWGGGAQDKNENEDETKPTFWLRWRTSWPNSPNPRSISHIGVSLEIHGSSVDFF